MNVAELIAELSKMPADARVIITYDGNYASDSVTGAYVSPLNEASYDNRNASGELVVVLA